MLTDPQLAAIAESPYKADFPLLAQNPQIAFLDSAATAQRPAAVLDAQRTFYETMNANPLRGLYRLSVAATSAIEDARGRIARFIGAIDEKGEPQASQIVFTRNTSESLNLVANTLGRQVVLGEGDEVVISIMEHHSNLIPWQQLCRETGARLVYLRMDDDFRITQQEIDEKIGPKAKIVSVTHVSNVLGVENDVAAIARRAHEMGAYMIVDGAQSVPHIPVDVRELDCDLLAFSAHKLGGPMGIGVLWGKADVLDAMPPFLTGGEMTPTRPSPTSSPSAWRPSRVASARSRPTSPTRWRPSTSSTSSAPPTAAATSAPSPSTSTGSTHTTSARSSTPPTCASVRATTAPSRCSPSSATRARAARASPSTTTRPTSTAWSRASRWFGRCSMDANTHAGVPGLYNPQFMDHVSHPDYRYVLEDATHTHEGVNPSCGDELTFYVRIGDDGTIEEASYQGHGCAISQASADMMSDLMVDKTPEEARALCRTFMGMVRGEETDAEKIASLEDAAMLKDISHMPARVKCAELAWRTLDEMLAETQE